MPAQFKYVTEYPSWTTGVFMCGMGALGGASVGFLTTPSPAIRLIEFGVILAALAAVVVPTVVRLRFRSAARAQFAAQGGDPTTLHFV